MKFTATGKTGGDETRPYKVTDYKAKTVVEFINEVLTEHPGEWGHFMVNSKDRGVLGSHNIEYSNGELKSEIPDEWQYVEIESIYAHGGWSLMVYMITPNEH